MLARNDKEFANQITNMAKVEKTINTALEEMYVIEKNQVDMGLLYKQNY